MRISVIYPNPSEEQIEQLAKSLAEFDGCIIVALDDNGNWEPRRPGNPTPAQLLEDGRVPLTRARYLHEARRFLHCYIAAKNIFESRVLRG